MLIQCPDCKKEISSRAEFCPHCGCPAKFFTNANEDYTNNNDIDLSSKPKHFSLTIDDVDNYVISFEQEYNTLFFSNHYITQREFKHLYNSFLPVYKLVTGKDTSWQSINVSATENFLTKFMSLDDDVINHNDNFVKNKVAEHEKYFDSILDKIDKNITLDYEQRSAVVTEDDYVLLVAGAGTGKTTTMAAKVKYLVDKCGVNPDDIIAISYTNKAINELCDRINKKLGIPARINTFHKFAFDVVRQQREFLPEVNYSAYRYILDILDKALFNNKNLMRNLVLFLGYYFDLTEDVFKFDSLNQYHLFKAQQDYETIKSSLGEYIQKAADKRNKRGNPRTITGEYLRSIQEVQIANFLYLNGLEYEYEPRYPYQESGVRKLYTPDFIIKQGDMVVYLEHYALTENGYNTMFTQEQIAKYKNSIKYKRNLHMKNDTTLLETWSLYSDRRPMLSHLREILVEAGFKLKQRNLKEVYKKLITTGKDKYIEKLIFFMRRFISQYKNIGYDAGGFTALRTRTDNPRTLLFLDIAEDVYKHYQEQLHINNKIDYEDMINDANLYLDEFEAQGVTLPYKYIIIDEFQDIARQRFNLTKRLSEITQAKVVAVGDDWQSIYAFAGSDITLFTRFLELMGSGTEMKITHTYRNSQELIDIVGGFIQKNTTQIQKRLISPKSISDPIVLEEYDDSTKAFTNLAKAVENVIGKLLVEFGEDQEILLLGRYNFDGHKLTNTTLFESLSADGDKIRCVEHPKAKITFLTAHSSKGLGFDNVILLNLIEGKYGFPSQIEDDPIIKLVTTEDRSIPYAEERRLFYVALTRTKNRVYLIAPQYKPSQFLVELVRDYNLTHSEKLNMDAVDFFPRRCPVCNYPLKYEFNKNYGLTLYICTNEIEICDFMTNHAQHLYDIFKCDENTCDGYMIVKTRKSDDKPFYGCTNFSADVKCRKSITINQN